MPDYFTVHHLPELRRPVFIGAFKGWNDAAEAASSVIGFMMREWDATKVASLDIEEFYDFTETRPQVNMTAGLYREVEWPSLDVYACTNETWERDLVLLVGHEPQLRWRTFTNEVLGLLDKLGVSEVVLLGALLADVPHTRAPRLIGAASDPGLRDRLQEMDVSMSRYEGPTGIVGVLQDIAGRRGLPTVSLWGNVPHYITASPNPQVSVALMRQVDRLLNLNVNLRTLERQARRFRTRVDEAIAQNAEASAYVRRLEGMEEDEATASTPERDRSPLPTGPEVVRALEDFLRQQRTDTDTDGESDGDED